MTNRRSRNYYERAAERASEEVAEAISELKIAAISFKASSGYGARSAVKLGELQAIELGFQKLESQLTELEAKYTQAAGCE